MYRNLNNLPSTAHHSYSTPASPNTQHHSTSENGRSAFDKELASVFRATAANVTQLYKEASEIGNTAYREGYEQCFTDIWEFIMTTRQANNSGEDCQMTLQQLMEFARLKQIAAPNLAMISDPVENNSGRIEGDRVDRETSRPPIAVVGNSETKPLAQSTNSSTTRRSKRPLDLQERMEIEPPRRRIRREDIDMV